MRFFARCALLLVCAFGVAAGASAPEDGDGADEAWADEDLAALPEVSVSAQRQNESLDDPPVFVETIDMKPFEGRFVTTEEVIGQAAGVNVRDFGGLGKLSTVSIRGSSADQVVVLVDGVRINPATGGGVDLSTIPPEQIERIEVVRGGDSAFYGEGAVGGVINIVTKKAAGETYNTVSTSYGSFNTFQAAATRSAGHGKWSYLASGSYLHSDGDFVFENDNGTEFNSADDFDDVRENNETDNRSVLFKVAYAPSDRVEIAAQNEFFSSSKGLPGLVTFPSERVHQQDLRNTTTVTGTTQDVGAKGLTLKTRAANRYSYTRFHDPAGEQTSIPLETTQHEYQPEIEQTASYLWGRHQVVSVSGLFRKNYLIDNEFDNPERTTWAASARDQLSFWRDRITLVPAVRYDDVSDIDGQWSPKFGLAVRPVDALTVKGNVGRSFRAPNFNELYFNQGLVLGNPDLKPERATNYDAGLQIATPWLFTEHAYFRSEVEDLIEYLLISGFRYKPYNIGKARLEGYEGSLRLTPFEYASLVASYTLTYAIDETEYPNRRDRQIPGRPRHDAFGRAEGHAGPFSPFVEYHYIGGNFVNQANTKLLDERHIWNAGLVANMGERYKLGVEVKNLADDRAVDVRGFPLPGRSVFSTLEAHW
ncbi:TonB-dependent receptor [bacterium]|nr:TonB-dependent receptor [bacterium]